MPYMTEEMWRIVLDIKDPFVLAQEVRAKLDTGEDPFGEDRLCYHVVDSDEMTKSGILLGSAGDLHFGFRPLLEGMRWLQDYSRNLQRAGKGAISIFQFPLLGGNSAKITHIEEISTDKFKHYVKKRRVFWCYEPLGRELLKQENCHGKIEPLCNQCFFHDALIALAMKEDQEMHDAIVYTIKKEFDPDNDGEVLAALSEFATTIGLNIVEYKGLPELMPAISMAGYEEYIKNGGTPNENVKRYITEREHRETTAKFRYVPSPKRLYDVLGTYCINQRVLKNNPEDVEL